MHTVHISYRDRLKLVKCRQNNTYIFNLHHYYGVTSDRESLGYPCSDKHQYLTQSPIDKTSQTCTKLGPDHKKNPASLRNNLLKEMANTFNFSNSRQNFIMPYDGLEIDFFVVSFDGLEIAFMSTTLSGFVWKRLDE